ncbi:hypothetical protein D3C72_1040830 [compost metagenome]
MALRDLADDRILEHLAVGQRHVRGDVDALFLQEGGQRAVLQIGAEFDLVGGDGFGAHGGDGCTGFGDGEVRDTDLARQALRLGLGQRAHAFRDRHAVAGRGPVDQGQVHVVGAQLGQAVLQAGYKLVLRHVGHPDFRGDEQVCARHAGFGDGLADLGFVFVDLRGVDGAVADVQRVAHGINDNLALQAERADAEMGNAHVKLQNGG